MNIAIALVLGILIGWLIEWMIDWFYWRLPRQEPASQPAAAPVPAKKLRYKTRPIGADDLKKIKGIGPVIEKQLNKVGIYKYRQIAELTLDEFEDALDDLLLRFISSRTILSHARELADQKKQGKTA